MIPSSGSRDSTHRVREPLSVFAPKARNRRSRDERLCYPPAVIQKAGSSSSRYLRVGRSSTDLRYPRSAAIRTREEADALKAAYPPEHGGEIVVIPSLSSIERKHRDRRFRGSGRAANKNSTVASLPHYDLTMDSPPAKNATQEAHQRTRVEPRPLAQSWADYVALDHKPKAEFNPARTTPIQQERDRR